MRRVRTPGRLEGQVVAFLVGLGSTTAEIAARLAGEGVRGVPGDTNDCAVAVYLRAVLGPESRVRSVKVTGDCVAVCRCRRKGISVALPEPVRAFIGEFDKGGFPVLVRAGTAKRASGIAEATHPPSGVTAASGPSITSGFQGGHRQASRPIVGDCRVNSRIGRLARLNASSVGRQWLM